MRKIVLIFLSIVIIASGGYAWYLKSKPTPISVSGMLTIDRNNEFRTPVKLLKDGDKVYPLTGEVTNILLYNGENFKVDGYVLKIPQNNADRSKPVYRETPSPLNRLINMNQYRIEVYANITTGESLTKLIIIVPEVS